MKIRGTTVGTTIKPEKILLKATDLTEEEKAQARANLGIGGSADFSWTNLIDVTVGDNFDLEKDKPYRVLVEFKEERLERLRKMSEFKLFLSFPFTERVEANAIIVRARFANSATSIYTNMVVVNNIACDAGKTLTMLTLSSKIGDALFNATHSFTGYTSSVTTRSTVAPSTEVFTVDENIWFKFALEEKYPIPMGSRIVLEGR